VPIKVLSEANRRDHWAAKHRRGKVQQQVVALSLRPALSLEPMAPPFTVTLTRLIGSGGRRLDDDNNASGFKAIRDAVAKCLGVDDGDLRVAWRCDQRKAPEWGVEVRIGRETTGA
jgi:hypothetical protein